MNYKRYEKMISSENVALNMNFLVSNILATKKATKATKTTLFKKCIFWAKIDFLTFFHIFYVFFKMRSNKRQHFCSESLYDVLNRFRRLCRNFYTRRNFYGSIFGSPTNENFKKSKILNFLKITSKCV